MGLGQNKEAQMAGLPQLYTYKAGGIEPVVLPGEIVGLYVNKQWRFAEVLYREPIPRSNPLVVDFGALAAGASSAMTQLTLLEMPDSEFGQFRMEAVDDIEMTLWQGRSDGRLRTKNRMAAVSRFTRLHENEQTTEFFVFEDSHAFGQALNPTGYANTISRVSFWGYRYVINKLTQYSYQAPNIKDNVPAQWTRVVCGAHL